MTWSLKSTVLKQVCIPLLDGLPTINWPSVRYIDRVLREERGGGSGIVFVHCIGMFRNDRDKLMA